jgi:hypothetical protein
MTEGVIVPYSLAKLIFFVVSCFISSGYYGVQMNVSAIDDALDERCRKQDKCAGATGISILAELYAALHRPHTTRRTRVFNSHFSFAGEQ